MAKKKTSKPYVYYDTIWKGVGGGLSNPGESRLCSVGKHKVLLTRGDRLDRYGNPVHTASLVRGGRTVGYSAVKCEVYARRPNVLHCQRASAVAAPYGAGGL